MRYLYIFVLLILTTGTACAGASGTDLCEETSQEQCDVWRSCFCPDGSCSHNGVSLAEGACTDALVDTCTAQASTLEDPAVDLQNCSDDLESWACADVRAAEAQSRATAPESCTYFF